MKSATILIIICFVHLSCQTDDNDCKSIRRAQINDALIPKSAMQDHPVLITIKASASNLCWSDLYVELKQIDKLNYTIQSYGTHTCCEDGCACPEAILNKDTTIMFLPQKTGIYSFSILERRNRTVVETMVVK